jgi:hypothetical protein
MLFASSFAISNSDTQASWEDALEWKIESALCAIDGLPRSPMPKIVAWLSECDG